MDDNSLRRPSHYVSCHLDVRLAPLLRRHRGLDAVDQLGIRRPRTPALRPRHECPPDLALVSSNDAAYAPSLPPCARIGSGTRRRARARPNPHRPGRRRHALSQRRHSGTRSEGPGLALPRHRARVRRRGHRLRQPGVALFRQRRSHAARHDLQDRTGDDRGVRPSRHRHRLHRQQSRARPW